MKSMLRMSYYILQNDETKGPFTIGQLRSMWSSGAITLNTLYCEAGYERWLPMSELLPLLEPSSSPLREPSQPPLQPLPRQAFPEPSAKKKARSAARLLEGIGTLTIVLSIPGCFAGSSFDAPALTGLSACAFVLGLTIFIIGRFRE